VVALLKLTGTYKTLGKGHLLGVSFIDLSREPSSHSSPLFGGKKGQEKQAENSLIFSYLLLEVTNDLFEVSSFLISCL